MKNKTLLMAMTLFATSFYATQVLAQTQSKRDHEDSVKMVTRRNEQLQETRDKNRMADAKLERKQTKKKAKNAQRIENDANDAARESRSALRAERKAQKTRKQATKQAEKAAEARKKSDKNN
jgi:hypothetical protein